MTVTVAMFIKIENDKKAVSGGVSKYHKIVPLFSDDEVLKVQACTGNNPYLRDRR